MTTTTPETEPGTPPRSQIRTTWNSLTNQATGLKTLAAAMLGLLLPNVALAAATAPALKAVADGFVFGGESDTPRVHFVGGPQEGYDVVFERQLASGWEQAATFPQGQVWSVYADWRDSWYAAPHQIKVQQVESMAEGRVRAWASADIAGQQWEVADVYSVEQGMVRIERSFAHPGSGTQSKITLESRLRLPLGTDQRMLMPGVLYNNNPATSITSGTKLSTSPGGLGLYEEHRLPIPMVNIESLVKGCRNYGSLVATPSRIPQGHKGVDHWWSMGLEYGQGYVDLLSVSGPVATNGKKSQVYGHLGGFDPYDDAYLDVQGPVVFKKTLYLDLGAGIKSGYAFRETLWKSYNVFRPVQTPHVPFAEAMSLITGHARTRYIKPASNTVIPEPAGYEILPGHGGFTYGWIGGNLGIAYGCLSDANRTGDETARKEAVSAIQYFVRTSQASVEGLYYGDCNTATRKWSGLSSRQYGENLGHLASLVELGWKMKLPEADEWYIALKKAGDFLVRSLRYKDLFPREWTHDGKAYGWPEKDDPSTASISAAGAFCIAPLARLAEMAPAEFPLNPQVAAKPVLRYEFPNHKITIDGNTADWDGIYKKNVVANADHLWFGQGMTALFKNQWAGEMAVKRTPTGYIAEIAFSVPGVKLQLGKTLGLDVAVCDDDGQSRKALQIWSGNRGEFWKTMDDHPVIILVEKSVKAPAGLRKLLDSYLRDTSICVGTDGTWYMTGTSDPPNGIRVWKSNDPEHAKWEALGLVWQPGASPWHQPYMKDKCPLWAPEIHHLKGNFWLTYSMPGWGGLDPKNSGCGLLKSTSGKPEGPYEDVQPNARLGDEIDASLFEDDVTVYYLWHNSKIAKMKPDMSGLAEPYRWLKTSVADTDPKHHGWACGSVCQDMNHVCYEGISMFKTNGLYYWCGSEAFDDRYSCSIATSKTIYGPYSERYEALPYCGHNNIFQDKDKQWWATFFGQNGIPWGEKPGILPVTIGADGIVRPK